MSARMQSLRNIVTDQCLVADCKMVASSRSFPTARNAKQLARFLGISNDYRQFYRQLGSIASPLSEWQSASKHWKWSYQHDVPFQVVKASIIYNKASKWLNSALSCRIYLMCYSSDTGIPACIRSTQDDGLIWPASCYNRKFRHSHEL